MKRQSKQKKKISTIKVPQKNFFQKIIFLLKKYIFRENFKWIFLLLIFGFMARDLFLLNESDAKFFSVIIAFSITTYFYNLKSRFTFIICLLLLLYMFIKFVQTGPSITTEKIAVWLFLFMAVGVLQQWKE